MKIKDIFEMAVTEGKKEDPRGQKGVSEELIRKKAEYEESSAEEKERFDTEKFSNPYSDTRILYGDVSREVKRVMVGIDIEVAELLLADRVSEKGKKIDLVISHHPEGRALAYLYEVMGIHSDIASIVGIPINISENLMEKRVKEVERRLQPVNHMRAVDAARILDIPFMCIHTAADNHVVSYLQKIFDNKKPQTLKCVMDILNKIPEYRQAGKNGTGPKIFVGNPKRRAGRVLVDMTGGTEGSKELIQKLADAGVGTLVGMHFSEDHVKEAEKHYINMVVAGHISSDNIGLNLLLDKLTAKGRFDIVECSGFERVKRK
ncbi:MAG: NGG1p interacting factor NIF3 [bacterium]|nr:NGG1p interacting factor NIF3 [bacterium]